MSPALKRRKGNDGLVFYYHGNYCGPGWSSGKYQASVHTGISPVDDFDSTCAIHDSVYAVGGDLKAADMVFAKENINAGLYDIAMGNVYTGVKRTLAGLAVGGQGLMRKQTEATVNKSEIPVVAISSEKSLMPNVVSRRRKRMPRSKRSKAKRPGPYRRRRYNRKRSSALRRTARRSAAQGGKGKKAYTQKKSSNKYSAYNRGVVKTCETGGLIDSPECVYIGVHNAPIFEVTICLAHTIVKELYRQKGEGFASWKDVSLPHPGLLLKYEYCVHNDTAITTASVTMNTGTATYEEIGEALATSLDTVLQEGIEYWFKRFYMTDSTADPNNSQVAVIVGNDFYIDMEFVTQMKIQNRTLPTATDTEMYSVRNNPLVGKVYYGNGQGPIFRSRNDNVVFQNSLANTQTGVISFTPTDYDETPLRNELQKPPLKNMFNYVTMVHDIKMPAGSFFEKKIISKHTFPLAKFYNRVNGAVSRASSNPRTQLGKFCFVGLEKYMDTRDENEPDISVGYEFNETFKLKGRYNPNTYTNRITEFT